MIDTDQWLEKKYIYWEKWVDLILDHILQDPSPDLSPALGQDPGHTLEKRDTVLGLVQGHTHDLAAGIVFILEIIAEITEIIEE